MWLGKSLGGPPPLSDADPKSGWPALCRLCEEFLPHATSWTEVLRLALTLTQTQTQTQTRTLTVRLRLTRLDDETQRKFTNKFQGASGSWCCAPGDEASKGAARSSYFRLLGGRPARPKLSLLRRAARMVTKRKAPA